MYIKIEKSRLNYILWSYAGTSTIQLSNSFQKEYFSSFPSVGRSPRSFDVPFQNPVGPPFRRQGCNIAGKFAHCFYGCGRPTLSAQGSPTACMLHCSNHVRCCTMVMPNKCPQAGPQPRASVYDIPIYHVQFGKIMLRLAASKTVCNHRRLREGKKCRDQKIQNKSKYENKWK